MASLGQIWGGIFNFFAEGVLNILKYPYQHPYERGLVYTQVVLVDNFHNCCVVVIDLRYYRCQKWHRRYDSLTPQIFKYEFTFSNPLSVPKVTKN